MAYSTSRPREARIRRVTAVEIGWEEVRAAEVEIRGGQPRVVKSGVARLPAGVWENIGAHRDVLAQAIRSALSSGGIRNTEVITVLPRRFVTVKYARLPQGTAEQIAGMVRFEAQQYVPFPIDEVVLDHQVVSDPGDDMATVLIAAARKSLVNELLAAFDRAGVEVSRISVSSFALAELLREEPLPTAICRLDDGQLDLAIAGAGRVLFSRAAELISGGDPTDALTTELARSLAAYQTEYRTRPVDKLVLASSEDEAKVTAEALASSLQVSVSVLDGHGGGMPDPGPVVLGMALHESAEATSTLNLLPQERRLKKVEARRKLALRVTLIAVLAALAVGTWLIMQAMDAQAQERRRALYENTRLKRIQPLVRNRELEAERLRKMYLTANYGLGRDKPVVDVIKAISDALPKEKGLRLTQLSFDRSGPVVLHGTAETQDSVTAFLEGLQSSSVFVEARLGYLGDASSAGKLRTASTQENNASSEDKAGLTFMLYCRLPKPPELDEKKGTVQSRSTTSAARPEVGP